MPGRRSQWVEPIGTGRDGMATNGNGLAPFARPTARTALAFDARRGRAVAPRLPGCRAFHTLLEWGAVVRVRACRRRSRK